MKLVEKCALAVVRRMVEEQRGLEVLTVLWPNALHRPLYTIEDMQRQADLHADRGHR